MSAREARVGPVVATAVANAAGTGSVTFSGPGGSWRVLEVDSIQLSSQSTARPTAVLYRGSAEALGSLLATVRDGNTGAFRRSGRSDTIAAGESWTVVWTGATPGASLTASLSGVERDR
jgi:hypothetical protein